MTTSSSPPIVQSGQLAHQKDLESILRSFPSDTIDYAFGYGSGVFQQKQSNSNSKSNKDDGDGDGTTATSSPMIDMIFVVSKPEKFHAQNLKLNPSHYAFLPKMMGSHFLTSFIQDMGAGVYFHPMVSIPYNCGSSISSKDVNDEGRKGRHDHHLVKYGIISLDRFHKDLTEWDTLYCAGRMHKPTLKLDIPDGNTAVESGNIMESISEWQMTNLNYAVATSLLLQNPNDFNDDTTLLPLEDLYETIAGLSYMGDPRFVAGAEDPDKVSKLVCSPGQMDRFGYLYVDALRELEHLGILNVDNSRNDDEDGAGAGIENVGINGGFSGISSNTKRGGTIELNLRDGATRRILYGRLPPNLEASLSSTSTTIPPLSTTTMVSPSEINNTSKVMSDCLRKIVGPPARVQSMKGIVTAGVLKSFRYASAKLAKGALKGIL